MPDCIVHQVFVDILFCCPLFNSFNRCFQSNDMGLSTLELNQEPQAQRANCFNGCRDVPTDKVFRV